MQTDCIIHPNKPERSGYVRAGRGKYAHRLAYEQAHGPIPEGMEVRHRCDTPPCVNPEHLEVGTHAENMADKTRRGKDPVGERNPMVKLSEADARAIRSSGESGPVLAARYGVTRTTINRIKKGTQWRHLSAGT